MAAVAGSPESPLQKNGADAAASSTLPVENGQLSPVDSG